MPIVSSVIVTSDMQSDGRHAVRERHTDDHGSTYDVNYMAEVATDETAVMDARVPSLNQMLLDLVAAAAAQQAQATAKTAAIQQAQAYLSLTDSQLCSVLLLSPGTDLTTYKANITIIAGGQI